MVAPSTGKLLTLGTITLAMFLFGGQERTRGIIQSAITFSKLCPIKNDRRNGTLHTNDSQCNAESLPTFCVLLKKHNSNACPEQNDHPQQNSRIPHYKCHLLCSDDKTTLRHLLHTGNHSVVKNWTGTFDPEKCMVTLIPRAVANDIQGLFARLIWVNGLWAGRIVGIGLFFALLLIRLTS